MCVCYGPWYHLVWKWKMSKDTYISHSSGTEYYAFDALPCGNGGLPARISGFFYKKAFVPHRGPIIFYGPEGGIPRDISCWTLTISNSLMTIITMYSSLVTISAMRCSKYIVEAEKSQAQRKVHYFCLTLLAELC